MPDFTADLAKQIVVFVGVFALLVNLMLRYVFPKLDRSLQAEIFKLQSEYDVHTREALELVRQFSADREPPTLEEEIAEVSGTLSTTVTRLRDISAKAQAFEAEVHELVNRADAAQATAQLNEEQAQKIAFLLTSQTEQKLTEEIEKLTAAHKEQIEGLKKSGTRSAWITFVLGALVGFVLNIVSSLIVS